MTQLIKVYQPISARQKNLIALLPLMIRDLINARELIWRLFLRDIKAKYKQSLLGWIWIILLPIMAVGTFLLLNRSGAISLDNIPAPYAIYGLLGISLWQIFSAGWSAATASIISAGRFITKINFAKEALVVSSLGQILLEFFIRIILLIVLFILYGQFPSIWIILLPLLIIPLILLTLGLGFISSLLNAVARDIQTFINVFLSFFLFFTPIMYTLPETSLLFKLNQFNPVFFLITVPRDLIVSGQTSHLSQFLLSSALALIIFLLGWMIFYKAQSKIAEAI